MTHFAKLLHLLLTPWRKYNEFFDNGCRGIWGLSPLLKFTFLFLVLFFVPPIIGVANYQSSDTSLLFEVLVLFFLIIAFIWLLYLPILCAITFARAVKKVRLAAKELSATLSEQPWDITPIKLYTQPHMSITIYLIMLKHYLIDLLDWTTQFYPISLLSTNKVPYPISVKITHVGRSFEMRIAALKIPFKYAGFELNQNFTLLKFEPYENIKDFAKVFKKLNKKLKHEISFYIRHENGQINIIVPHAQ